MGSEALARVKRVPYFRSNDFSRCTIKFVVFTLTEGPPFYQSHAGTMVHRVRSGHVHTHKREVTHTSLKLWCGQIGHLRRWTRWSADPGEGVLCATCEGRAIGAGQLGSAEIAGRPVRFSPRGGGIYDTLTPRG